MPMLRKLWACLERVGSPPEDTDWAVHEHWRSGWVEMTDGHRTNPQIYMIRYRSGVLEKKRATAEDQRTFDDAVEDGMNSYP